MDKQLPFINNDNHVREYIALLLNNGQDKEAKQTDELLQYIGQLEQQYLDIAKELQEMKSLLNNMQNPSFKVRLKSNIEKEIEKAEVSINAGQKKLSQLKSDVMQSIKQSIDDFKKIGKQGVVKTIHVFHIKDGLESIRKTLFQSMHHMKQVSLTCDSMTLEMRKSKNHFKNIGRMIRGLPIQTSVDNHKVNLIQKCSRKISRTLEKMCIHTTHLLHSIEDLEKPSVKKEIKSLESKSIMKEEKNKDLKNSMVR